MREQGQPLPYTILEARSITGLIDEVGRCLKMDNGTRWQLQGGVSVAQTAEGPLYLQALVRSPLWREPQR